MLKSAHAVDQNILAAKPVLTKPGEVAKPKTAITPPAKPVNAPKSNDEIESVVLYSIHKVVDGETNERASRAGILLEDAEAYVAERPDNEYQIIPDE